MSERIQWVAGIIFALAFVALLSMMNMDVLRYGASVNSRVNNQIAVSESYEMQSFDGTVVTGDTVKSAIKNQNTMYTHNLEIKVDNVVYPVNSNTDSIGLSTKYTATLITNPNGIITGVEFTS